MEEKKKNRIYVWAIAVLFFGLSIWAWVKPSDVFSQTERRELKQFPEISWESVADGRFMQTFEEYTLDQFPLRNAFREVKAFTHMRVLGQSDNRDVYEVDGYISKMEPTLSQKALGKAVKKFESIYEKYIQGSDAKVYYGIIPDKNYYLADANGYLAYDYNALYSYMNTELEFMEYIEIADLLSVEDYYFTDSHWKQDKIVDVARRLAEKMGVELKEEYETLTLDSPFYGVYYGHLALPMNPDYISYLENPLFAECRIINHANGKEIPMYDMELATGRDPYEMFLSGSQSVITIENPNAKTEKELVVFRDSFGSSIAPLLVEGYSKIMLLDARYLNEMMIGKFVEFTNQDVLFLYSTSVLNNETAF